LIDYPTVILILGILAFVLLWKWMNRSSTIVQLFKEQADWLSKRIDVADDGNKRIFTAVRYLTKHVTGTDTLPGDINPHTGNPITDIENPGDQAMYDAEQEILNDPDRAAQYIAERWKD